MPAPAASTLASAPQNGVTPPSSTNPAIERKQSQWIFGLSDLQKTPSIVEGLPALQELANRQKGINFITKVGIMLKLPQLTLSTASVFLHRYYMRYPMQVPSGKGTHHYQIAATALFLATKVEENCRKMKELIVACCRVAQKNPNAAVDEQSKEYWKWRDTILHHEDMLLEALCFDLQLEQPYQILFDFLCYYGVQDRKSLRNISWAFLNDSYLTTICLLFSPKTAAGSALYAGLKLAGVSLPDDEHGRPWWNHLGLNILDVAKACNMMVEVYENPTQSGHVTKDTYLKAEDIMSFDRTRRTQSPSIEQSPTYSMASPGTKRERESSWGHEDKNVQPLDRQLSQQSPNDHVTRSPKRLRTENGTAEPSDDFRSRRAPPETGGRIPVAAQELDDDVQKRIDDIVNASSEPQAVRHRSSTNGLGSNPREVLRDDGSGRQRQASHEEAPSRDIVADHEKGDIVRNGDPNSTTKVPRIENPVPDDDYGSEEGEV